VTAHLAFMEEGAEPQIGALEPLMPSDKLEEQTILQAEETQIPIAITPSQHERLRSLDIMRGLTIAGMIFADEIGAAYPHLNHSPWNDITMADFIMPWFLFMVGASMAFSLRKFRGDRAQQLQGLQYVVIRSLKLYVLGVLIRGGGWPDDYQYGYNLWNLRWCGILQRIAFAYCVVGLIEIFLPVITQQTDHECPPSPLQAHLGVFTRHSWKWLVASLCSATYLMLLYLTYVPSWTVEIEGPAKGMVVKCDTRGSITPGCCAIGYYDRLIFGQRMCRSAWMASRLPECSSCSPGSVIYSTGQSCALPLPEAPVWCHAPLYDPEGALSTLNTVMSTWIGVHFGHVLKHPPALLPVSHRGRLAHWLLLSGALMGFGIVIHMVGHEMNKQVWTFSYALFMAGTCGGFLALWYVLVDSDTMIAESLQRWSSWLLSPLRFMGMNAILVFTWHGLASAVLNVLYWQPNGTGEKHNLIGWLRSDVFGGADTCAGCQLAYVLCKISCFAVGCWICARVGYFWKL